MRKLFGKLFGSDKMVDAGIKAGDAIWFTDEEKAEWHLRLLKAYEPFKLAQRLIALTFCIPYVLLTVVMFSMGLFWGVDVLDHLRLLNELFGGPVSAILFLYFGGGAIEGAVKAGKSRKD